MRILAILLLGLGLCAAIGCSALPASATFRPEGMALGPVHDADEAAADGQAFSTLTAPITVLDVRSGIARDLTTAAYPSFTEGDPAMEARHQQFLLKLDRPAWRVRLTGSPRQGNDCCVWEELVIDAETGSVLFGVQANGIPTDP